MSDNPVLVEIENHVATVTLNRTAKGNALTQEMLFLLMTNFEKLAENDDVRAVVLTGAGDRAFCAGYDVTALLDGVDPAFEERLAGRNPFLAALAAIETFPYPVLAMVNGYAFGGGFDLAMSCDLRLGAETIKMGMVPAKLGVVYFPEGLARFIRVAGLTTAREMFYTGRTYLGPALKAMGIVDHLLPAKDLRAYTYEMAEEIAHNAPLSLKGIKKILGLVSRGNALSHEEQQAAEELVRESFASQDLIEGQTAFLEKRKPVFKGR